MALCCLSISYEGKHPISIPVGTVPEKAGEGFDKAATYIGHVNEMSSIFMKANKTPDKTNQYPNPSRLMANVL